MVEYKNIDEYIKNYPKETQAILQKVRELIQKTAPDATEAIAYGLATFKLNGKNLVHFGAYENHIGFYPTPSGISAFEKELIGYKGAKGSVQFPKDQVPYDLIKKIVEFRVKENSSKN